MKIRSVLFSSFSVLCVTLASGVPAFSQGWVFQAGALQSKSKSGHGWNAENYPRAFASVGWEWNLGPRLPILSLWGGGVGSSSEEAKGTGDCGCTYSYSPGAAQVLGMAISSAGRFRVGGGLELRSGRDSIRSKTPLPLDTSLPNPKRYTDTWLLFFSEAEIGKGFSVVGRVGMGNASTPRPALELGLGLSYRP